MIDWQPMSAHPLDADPVLICFRCDLTGQLETAPGWYDDGTDSDGDEVEEPGWHAFDQMETGPREPLCWAKYPLPNADDWKRLGRPQVAA